MKAKVRKHNKLSHVQEMERQRWVARWQEAHPGEEYERRQFREQDEYGRECSYSGEGSCGHTFKPWSEFPVRARRTKGGDRETRCFACTNSRNLYSRFAITTAERDYLDEVAVFGKGLCDLHGGPETMEYLRHGGGNGVRGLSIDHAHDCDQGHAPEKGCRYCIRGLLCCECNRTVVRMAEQFPALAVRFKDYLERRPLL